MFAGVFLAVLVAATIVQVVVSVGVMQPLALQGARESAAAALDRAAPDLIALDDPFRRAPDHRNAARIRSPSAATSSPTASPAGRWSPIDGCRQRSIARSR